KFDNIHKHRAGIHLFVIANCELRGDSEILARTGIKITRDFTAEHNVTVSIKNPFPAPDGASNFRYIYSEEGARKCGGERDVLLAMGHIGKRRCERALMRGYRDLAIA